MPRDWDAIDAAIEAEIKAESPPDDMDDLGARLSKPSTKPKAVARPADAVQRPHGTAPTHRKDGVQPNASASPREEVADPIVMEDYVVGPGARTGVPGVAEAVNRAVSLTPRPAPPVHARPTRRLPARSEDDLATGQPDSLRKFPTFDNGAGTQVPWSDLSPSIRKRYIDNADSVRSVGDPPEAAPKTPLRDDELPDGSYFPDGLKTDGNGGVVGLPRGQKAHVQYPYTGPPSPDFGPPPARRGQPTAATDDEFNRRLAATRPGSTATVGVPGVRGDFRETLPGPGPLPDGQSNGPPAPKAPVSNSAPAFTALNTAAQGTHAKNLADMESMGLRPPPDATPGDIDDWLRGLDAAEAYLVAEKKLEPARAAELKRLHPQQMMDLASRLYARNNPQ